MTQSASYQGDSPGWNSESEPLIGWYRAHRSRFPKTAFKMGPGVQVTESGRFFAALDCDVAAGPLGPRARNGALQDDLRRIRDLFDRPGEEGCNAKKLFED
jgi:hypothetical protein